VIQTTPCRNQCFYLAYRHFGLLVLHHCVVIFFWSSEIMDCMLFTFEKKSSAHALRGVSGVISFITTLMNRFKKNQSCFFPVQAMLPGGLLFHQFIFTMTKLGKDLVPSDCTRPLHKFRDFYTCYILGNLLVIPKSN